MSSWEKILKSIGLDGVPIFKNLRNDDSVDRLSHRLTVMLLVLFAFILTTKQFVGEPIYCWTPAHFMKDSHDEYTNSYCWIRNTYYLPYEERIPTEQQVVRHDGKHTHVTYYQWVPAILLVEALMFYLPYLIWNSLSTRSGIDIQSIVDAGNTFEATEMTEIREKTLMYMTSQLDRYLRCHKDANTGPDRVCTLSFKHLLTRTCCLRCGRQRGNYLILLYAFVKLLYLVNAVGQIFLLDLFLGGSVFHAYGIDVLRGAADLQSDWPETGSARFPRVTMCDVKIRRLGNIHRYTVQCVLPINAFSEKIFLFFWFWFVFVAFVTLVSLVLWIVRFAIPSLRRRYVKQHISYMKKPEKRERRKVRKFVHDYLSQDGVFILRLVTHNTSTITTTEFVYSLWEHFRKKATDEDEVDGSDDIDTDRREKGCCRSSCI